MTAITVSAYSRTAPRGAVVAAEVFTWLLSGLRAALSRGVQVPADATTARVMPGAFPA